MKKCVLLQGLIFHITVTCCVHTAQTLQTIICSCFFPLYHFSNSWRMFYNVFFSFVLPLFIHFMYIHVLGLDTHMP